MEEAKIPVFSVLKKGTTLKNIFLNSPPQEIRKPSSPSTENDPILIGRHPNCHIVVDHPSISRFHLEVRPKTTLQKIFITDRSSVHGTWVSGKKILPNIPIELMEGDTVRLGASSRVYHLHWMPLSQAFEMEKPMSPLLEEEVLQDEYLNDACFSYVIPSAPPLSEIMNAPSPGKPFSLDSKRNGQTLKRKEMEEESSCFSSIAPLLESVSSSLPMKKSEAFENFFENEMKPKREERSAQSPLTSDKRDQSSSLLSRRNKSIRFLQIEKTSKAATGENRYSVQREVEIEEQDIVAFERGYGEEKFLADEEDEEEELFVSDKENMTPLNSIVSKALKSNREIVRSPLSALRLFSLEGGPSNSDNENVTLEALKFVKTDEPKSEQSPMDENKAMNVEEDIFHSDKENWTPEVPKSLKAEKALTRVLLKVETPEDEAFVLDKEESKGYGANDLGEMFSSKVKLQRSLFRPERSLVCENIVLNVEEESSDNQHMDELPHMLVREKKKWYLIVDVGCFLNEESWKSLRLLEGIRGTQLIIPRIVIRELDHLKRSEGLFSRGTKASSVLQWIEKCMVKTSWWIHIQSTSETLPVVPTPPATPRSQLCDGTTEFCATGFSTCGSLVEIVSPTVEDHIIDCALLFKKIKDDGQLMLLSSSTTLRIKAMAEGLRCETPKEFRESLVNPFSSRFLWTDSSPRGSTWSCFEEVGPSDSFQQFSALRTTKAAGTVKGLKLILLHNSHYGAINSVY